MTNFQLAEGVQLCVLPSEKYKTIKLVVRFAAPLAQETITKRTLLSSLLETNCQKYATQTQLSERLAELYGASFGVNVSKKGNYHFLTTSMTLVNPDYLSEATDLLADAVAFLGEILFAPNVTNEHFHEETFQREKTNLEEYLLSLADDKQTYAALKLQELYFSDSPHQRIPSFGTVEDLAEETASSAAAYYQKMLQEDQVTIFVLGDVTPEKVVPLFAKWPLAPRKPQLGALFYQKEATNLINECVERENITQSRLHLGYQTGIYFHDEDYFALQVFNGLFGGYPHSKLFMNVREKASMAYSASSSFDSFRGMLTVQTGIEARNRDRVLALVDQQLLEMQQANFSEAALEQTKAMLMNQYYLALDNPNATIERVSLEIMVPKAQLTPAEWCHKIEQVTPEQVAKVAAKIRLQAVFFLEGGGVE